MLVFKSVAVSAAMVLSVGFLAACSSDGSGLSSASPTASASSEPTGSMVGGDPSTWAPVEVSPAFEGAVLEMVPGQAGRFVGLPDVLVEVQSSDPAVVVVSQASDDGTTQMTAGFQAVAAGSAIVTVTGAADGAPLLTFTVVVNP